MCSAERLLICFALARYIFSVTNKVTNFCILLKDDKGVVAILGTQIFNEGQIFLPSLFFLNVKSKCFPKNCL